MRYLEAVCYNLFAILNEDQGSVSKAVEFAQKAVDILSLIVDSDHLLL